MASGTGVRSRGGAARYNVQTALSYPLRRGRRRRRRNDTVITVTAVTTATARYDLPKCSNGHFYGCYAYYALQILLPLTSLRPLHDAHLRLNIFVASACSAKPAMASMQFTLQLIIVAPSERTFAWSRLQTVTCDQRSS